ncbi:MAG: YHYH protein, partial [Bacteroidia bacterium]
MKAVLQAIILIPFLGLAQVGPEITSWIINVNNATGYGGIVTNVQQVQYSNSNVYVSASCVPSYSIGPWQSNPNTPSNQNFVYKITRNPQQNTGTPTAIGLGHIGVWTNGVSIFNVSDAMSYNNQGIWNRNAYFWEGISFDDCLGHPAPNGEYHHHVSPRCLYNITDSSKHSPIIGYAFDGYPVYGAWAYANTNGTGGIKRMRSSYTPTTTAARTNGPNVDATYPVGAFIEDYQFVQGSGDLDFRNGRFCVTPEYPSGTYAYFVTLDANLDPQFPYTMIDSYYGVVQAGNTGPMGGHNSVTESVVTYTPPNGLFEQATEVFNFEFYPNPTS